MLIVCLFRVTSLEFSRNLLETCVSQHLGVLSDLNKYRCIEAFNTSKHCTTVFNYCQLFQWWHRSSNSMNGSLLWLHDPIPNTRLRSVNKRIVNRVMSCHVMSCHVISCPVLSHSGTNSFASITLTPLNYSTQKLCQNCAVNVPFLKVITKQGFVELYTQRLIEGNIVKLKLSKLRPHSLKLYGYESRGGGGSNEIIYSCISRKKQLIKAH